MTRIVPVLTRDMLANKHERPENPMDSDTLRRISASWTSLAISAAAAGDLAVSRHHAKKAVEYRERANRMDEK